MQMHDTPSIEISQTIRDSFPCIYSLLQEFISDTNGFFQEPAFHTFFASPKTRLVFSVKQLVEDDGGVSDTATFDTNWYFKQTIYLNRKY